ncbi:hypothetical protein [Gloeocapsopsis dulcis]|uniref:Uncharacterized protein n=1 Tax=Gloeocapsopsis dulcis AAB1 = 1H9 TaxID=1433147 RepID=A0A6N8G108_9CHRO|nr:hypothetical protein [Gloeocapsopsis dulcis]MUL38779.1 hypothetical protein [Gloeocapsopsis dulcis AAB1 = 1H9]WNN91795.1 hypothetical protein P0S91_12310 [Gloeocapsopsis dulcis]
MSTNPNDYKSYNRERQETHTDANGNTHTNVIRTNETLSGASSNVEAYREGYVQGQVSENYQEEVLAVRDNENASRGLLLGILLASLAALTAGGIWLLNQRNEPVPTNTNIVVPAPNSEPSPAASPVPENRTTIIDRVREVPVPVPVPQQQAPAPEAPDVNITLPSPAAPVPATQPEPTQPTQSQSQDSGTTSAPDTQGSETTNATESATDSNSEQSNTSTQ